MSARYDTVATIVSDVGAELALGTLTAAFPSTDATVSQLQALIKATGRRLVREWPWLQNLVDISFVISSDDFISMPDGFLRMENGTGWNRTTRQPLVPITPQQWEALQAGAVTIGTPALVRVRRYPGSDTDAGAATIQFLSQPDEGDHIYLQYRSQYWLATAVDALVSKDAPTATSDIVRIDPYLFTRALKLAWLRAKGFESTAAQQDHEAALDAVRSLNVITGPSLSLNGGRLAVDRLLGSSNIPETGFGQ